MNSLNHILDASTPYSIFSPYISAYSQSINIFKFGWGSALIDPEFEKKIQLLRQCNVIPMLGGTMFEYFYHKDRLSDFNEFLNSFNIDWVELSRGSIDIDDDIYFSLVKEYSSDFTV